MVIVIDDIPTVIELANLPTFIELANDPTIILADLEGGGGVSGPSNLFAHDDVEFVNVDWNFGTE